MGDHVARLKYGEGGGEEDDADEYAAALPQKTAPFGDSTLQSVPVVRLGLDASEDDED